MRQFYVRVDYNDHRHSYVKVNAINEKEAVCVARKTRRDKVNCYVISEDAGNHDTRN